MFERYTERARRTIFFARYEASQFGSPYIESEHLLLGILRENKHLAERFLGANATGNVRREIERHTPVRAKVSTSVDLPLSHESKRILAFGAEEAKNLGHKHIDSEHLLIGVLVERDCFGARMLHERGIDLEALRQHLQQSQPSEAATQARLAGLVSQSSLARYTEAARWVLFLSRYEAGQFASPRIETEHLLLGLLFEDRQLAQRVLKSGESVDSLRNELPRPETALRPHAGSLTFSDECQRILQSALEEAGEERISLDDLLAAILNERDCIAAKILRERVPGPL